MSERIKQLDSPHNACMFRADCRKAEAEIAGLRDVLIHKGFVECDIPACNCGWHHRYGLPERWAEIKEVLIDADVLDTGNMPLNAIKKLISQLAELQKRLADAGEGLPPTMPGFPENAIATVDDFVEVKEYAVALRAAAESIIARKDAEIARLREDAARYRWLRSYRGSSIDSVYNYGGNEELDGVIDAARKK